LRTVARIGLGIIILLLLAIPAWPLINLALVPYRVSAALHNEDLQQRVSDLTALQADYPQENQQALLRLADDSDAVTRSRAVSYLVNTNASPRVTNAFLQHLLNDPAGEVRLCCAVALLSDQSLDVQQAFIQSLKDKNEQVVRVAIAALRRRGGAAVVKPLFGLLHHASWNVRLDACKALIALNVADSRVVATVETLSHEPEAAAYDAQVATTEQREHELGRVPELNWGWGKINTILKQAKMIVATNPHPKKTPKPATTVLRFGPATPTATPLPQGAPATD